MSVNLERGRHVRMAELRLRHPQRSSLLVEQRSMCVPQRVPIKQSEPRLLSGWMELASSQILRGKWRT
jgi:hypothetical protein